MEKKINIFMKIEFTLKKNIVLFRLVKDISFIAS